MVAIIMFKINPKMKLRKHYIYKEIKENKVLGNKFNKVLSRMPVHKLSQADHLILPIGQ